VVAPADGFAKLLPELELAEAAALPLVGLTGAQLVEKAADVHDGDVVLVTGAVGSVGRVAVYTARQRGAKVIAGVRASQKQLAEALDAEAIVALDDAAELSHLPKLDAIADTVGGDVVEPVLGKLKPGGTVATVVGEPKGARERGLNVRTLLAEPDPKRLGELGEALARGHLELPIHERIPLAEVGRAHELAERGGIGKLVLLVRDE
jgi:NADPH:quinone reductase-like Zn-dependent oxidoreductase